MSLRDFEELVQASVAHELTPKEHEKHPDLDQLLTVMADDVSEETRGAVVAHVATCSSCRGRWRAVERDLQIRQEKLEARVQVPSLAEMVRERERSQRAARRTPLALGRWPAFRLGAVLRPALVPALASVAAVALTLGIAVPVLRDTGPAAADRLAALTREVEALRHDTRTLASALAQAGATIPANVLRPEVSSDMLVQLANAANTIQDPWQRALYLASVLNRWGIEPPALFAWQSLRARTVAPGDTWQSLAGDVFGDAALWPLLWLLNSGVSRPDRDPPIGSVVSVPVPLK